VKYICPILTDTRQALNSLWSSLPDSPFHDGSYIFLKRHIWTSVNRQAHPFYGAECLETTQLYMQNEAWHCFASQERCHLDVYVSVQYKIYASMLTVPSQ